MISKTRIGKRIEKKTEPSVKTTLLAAKKNKEWIKVAQILSGSTRKYLNVNLKYLEEKFAEGDTVIIPGKVLGSGEITKKLRVCALKFSRSANLKIRAVKGEAAELLDEIKKNPKAQGVKLIK